MNMTLIITGGMLGAPKIGSAALVRRVMLAGGGDGTSPLQQAAAFDFPADWHKIEAGPGKSRSPSW
jgi:hypothetical protein